VIGLERHANEIAFDSFGVRVAVTTSEPEALDRVKAILPPGWQPCPASAVQHRFSVTLQPAGTYVLKLDEEPLAGSGGVDLDVALELLDNQLRIQIGVAAPDTIFVHAGVVAHQGRTVVIPAMSFGGKTTLVAALVKAGAVYFSDEFAVIDRDGLVHPYPKPLSIRDANQAQVDHTVESLGGVAADEPLPLGMIVATRYRADATWKPNPVSTGTGAMALMANAAPAQERPGEAMQVISRATRGALVLEGERGEADETAPLVLAELERHVAERLPR
jgi:hypothetical protein